MNGTATSSGARTTTNNNNNNSKNKKDNEVKVCRSYMNKLGTIDACTANIGGSIMIDQIKKNHTVNMMSMKKRVDNELPWSYRNVPANFNLNRRVSPLKKPKTLSPINTKDNRMATLSTQQHRGAHTERGGSKSKLDLSKDNKIDPVQLLEEPEDQEIYEKFLDLLRRRKTIEEARKIASSVFLEAEEQMLLGAYSGVPQYVEGFISKDDENQSNEEHHEELEEDKSLENHAIPQESAAKEEELNEGQHETSFATLEEHDENVSNPYEEHSNPYDEEPGTNSTTEPSNE